MRTTVACSLFWLASTVVAARQSSGSGELETRRVEVTPFFGYQVGGEAGGALGRFEIRGGPAYGVLFDVRVRPDATIQLVYGRQETDVDIQDNRAIVPERFRVGLSAEYFQFGGTAEFGEERMRPYFALTVGAVRFHPQVAEAGDEWRFSVGFGGGFKYYVSNRFALRVDGRVYPTFLSTDGGLFCTLPGGCLVSVTGDFLVQANVTVGLVFGF